MIFYYEAIFIHKGAEPLPKSIINEPELQVYISEFGTRNDEKNIDSMRV